MIFNRARRGVVGAFCAMSLAACSVLPKPEPVDVYMLPASTTPVTTGDSAQRPWSLRIARPDANGQLVGQRILVIPEPNRVSVYQGANWHEPASLLVRNRLFDAFRADGRVSALSTDEMRTFADFELGSDLGAFHSEYRRDGAPPEVVIRLDVRLIETASRHIVASRAFVVREPATESAIPAVVAAFGVAANRLAFDLVAWTISGADAARKKETTEAAEVLPVTPGAP
ncbi:MAG: ABC-type transport auxiliary lipoprotein family protein [Azoarcus sp.]|jgi:cholesterol transport system auxiliary component|nr:ABC-type transport auxiliary lipoprotein family protein [Azoarcus sp.]